MAGKPKTDEKEKEAEGEAQAQPPDLLSETPRMDETVPGGVYIVNRVKVNAEGEPIE